MQFHERYKNYPINFYEEQDGSVTYSTSFFNGKAKSLEDAFKKLQNVDLEWDLTYFYDDIQSIQVGAFTPSYNDKITKGRKYLGQIELKLEIEPKFGTGLHSVTHLSKHPEDIPEQEKFIKKLKRAEYIDNLKKKFKNAFSKLSNIKSLFLKEFFEPFKARKELICNHCGELILPGLYYEEYKKENYHIECIWDKFCNEYKSRSRNDCIKFFNGLSQYLDNWPNTGYAVKEDYLSDLELVRHNNRVRNENI